MRKPMLATPTAAAVASALLAAVTGCGVDEWKTALPANESVTIPVPSAGGKNSATTQSSSGVGEDNQALLGQLSEYYALTYGISAWANGGTLVLLGLLHLIVEQPPTTQTATSRTWGPWTPGGLDPLTYRAQLQKTAPGTFTFSVDARPRSSTSDGDYLTLLDGNVLKRNSAGSEKGQITIDYDNREKLPGLACGTGNVLIDFDNDGQTVTLDITFTRAADTCKGDTPTDALYHFSQTRGGAGDFSFAIRENVYKAKGSALEDVKIRSRWMASGAGRSDVVVSGGDVAVALQSGGFSQTQVTGAQCWDDGFATVWETSSPAQLDLIPSDGDPAKCAFTSAMLPE